MENKHTQDYKPEIQHPTIKEVEHKTLHPNITEQATKRSSYYPTA
ncbi:hypothetical protein [Bacillus solimangrovi]|nr:hypothetical protein [Bacillus solimangrovi]